MFGNKEVIFNYCPLGEFHLNPTPAEYKKNLEVVEKCLAFSL